jgi:tetratricopeptide (TPR) repeat protein
VALQRTLEGDRADILLLPMREGQFAHVEVMQTGSNVAVVLRDPAGKEIALVDSPNGAYGPEPVSFIAALSGDYRIEVKLGNPRTGKGSYRVVPAELRAPVAGDLERISVEQDVNEANRVLGQRRTAESRQAALLRYNRALDYFAKAGDRYRQALTLHVMSFLTAESGELGKALELALDAFRIFSEIGDQAGVVLAGTNVGAMEDLLGQPQKAIEAYERALKTSHELGDRRSQATVLNNLGKIQSNFGNWQSAIEEYRQALGIYHALGDVRNEGNTLHNTGMAYLSLGEREQALEFLEQALPLRRANGDGRGEADTLFDLAGIYGESGNMAKALEYYELSLAARRALGDKRGEAVTLAGLGKYQSGIRQFDAADATLRKALDMAKSSGDRRYEAISLRSLSENSLAAGKADESVDWAAKALPIFREIEARGDTALALEQLARSENGNGNPAAARGHIEEALRLIEETRTRSDSEQLRASFFANQQDAYGFYIDLLMRMRTGSPGDAELLKRAFETTERARARSLVEMLAESGTDPRQGADPALLQRQRDITNLLNAQGTRLLASADPNSAAATTLKKEIRALELEYSDAEAAIRKGSPHYASLTQPSPPALEEVQKDVLDADTVLLEYTLGAERSWVFQVDQKSVTYRELPGREKIEAAARKTVDLLTARAAGPRGETAAQKRARVLQADVELASAARGLSEMLFGTSAPPAGKRLVIVPDGGLQRVPFAMLPLPGSGDPMVTQHEVVTLPSISTVAILRKEFAGRKRAEREIAVFADPAFDGGDTTSQSRLLEHLVEADSGGQATARLRIPRLPYTLREADQILKAGAGPSSSLRATGVGASRAAALNGQLEQYRYVHFATHGYLDTEQPSLSALVLSQVDDKKRPVDGFLRVNDIYNMRLNADLVVLSACQTGLGKEVRGEGLMGLTRAFMYAGAARVIVSLWNVNDQATADLMGELYRKMLREGKRPAEALREAQMYLRKDKQWESPYYWAAFQLQGDWR